MARRPGGVGHGRARRLGVDATVVLLDNDGGGIFSFLPQAQQLSERRFEQLFGTPHGSDVVALAAAHGLPAVTVRRHAELIDQLITPGPWVVTVTTERPANVSVHDELQRSVATAIDPQGTRNGT